MFAAVASHQMDRGFCQVKTYIHDERLQDPPLLVLPHCFQSRIGGFYPPDATPAYELSKDTIGNYIKLAKEFRKPHIQFLRAADYLESLCQDFGGARRVKLKRFTWLQQERWCAPPATCPSPTGNEQYEHLPKTSWSLKAHFKW